MALRLSSFAIVIPGLLFACGEDHGAPVGPGGSSNQAAGPGAVVAGSGGTASSSSAGTPSGGTSVGTGGVASKAGGGSGERPESGGANAGSPTGGTRATPGDAGSTSSGVTGNGGTDGGGPAGTAGEKAAGGSGASSGSAGAGLAGGGTGGAAPSGAGTGGADAPMTWAPTFQTITYMFEAVPCYGSNCHNSPRNHFQVQKSDDELYRYMMSFTTLECGKLIDKANPPNSALVKYLKGPCGSIERMPPGWCVNEGDPWCLPEGLIQAVEDWIAAGAPR